MNTAVLALVIAAVPRFVASVVAHTPLS